MESASTDLTLTTSWDFGQTTGTVPIYGSGSHVSPLAVTGDPSVDLALLAAVALLALAVVFLALAVREGKSC